MANYLRPQTVRDVLRSTFAVYGKGFVVIFLSYFLPLLPLAIGADQAGAAHAWGLYWLISLCSLLVGFAATAATTISGSDICLGNVPSLARSYKKVFAVLLKLLGTYILQVIIVLFILFIGLVPAIIVSFIPAIIAIKLLGISILHFIIIFIGLVPGIIAGLWLIFTPSVVILEGLGGFAALKRSKDLAHGYNWRNLGVILLLAIILFVIGFIIGEIFRLWLPPATHAFLFRFVLAVLNLIEATIMLTMFVLLYYDLRVRKEAYDAAALAEDLRR